MSPRKPKWVAQCHKFGLLLQCTPLAEACLHMHAPHIIAIWVMTSDGLHGQKDMPLNCSQGWTWLSIAPMHGSCSAIVLERHPALKHSCLSAP
eukprot:6490386-Amphidinium_carterae.2